MNLSTPSGRSDDTIGREEPFWRGAVHLVLGLALVSLLPLSRVNYLLFHALVELGSIAVAITLFSIGWNTRQMTRNDGFTLLSIAFLIIAVFDLVHTLAYKGMGVFPAANVDLPTQFWIAARATEAGSYLLAGLLFGRSGVISPWRTLAICLGLGLLLGLSIWPLGIFPSCLDATRGLTPFKVAAEYLICLVLAVSGYLFWRQRKRIDARLLQLLLLSILLTIFSEISFTLYRDVYGISNVTGHFLKLASVIVVYRALVLGSLRTPYRTLFRELSESHATLDQELARRRATEEQLRQANRELETFVRTVSHDLRMPLTVITSGAELLHGELAGRADSDQLDILDNINKQGHRMSRLLHDLLDLARVGTLDSPPEALDPELIAAQAVQDLSAELMKQGGGVVIDEMPQLVAHASLVYQLLLNLIGNAVRYGSRPDRPIVVGAERRGERYRFFVRDHGPGIPLEERAKIFDLFYRVDADSSRGTGIGLAIVQKIARHYSGEVWVEETAGGGATFRVEIADRQEV